MGVIPKPPTKPFIAKILEKLGPVGRASIDAEFGVWPKPPPAYLKPKRVEDPMGAQLYICEYCGNMVSDGLSKLGTAHCPKCCAPLPANRRVRTR